MADVTTSINRIETEVSTQTDLLAQIKAALEAKVAGSS